MSKRKNTTFILTGGAGRIVTAIPALEKYARLNPKDDFKVLVHGWESLFWSHPILQDRVFSAVQKGTFEIHIKDNRVICPEPYHNHNYFNQKANLAEAFDEEINQTDDHTDLNYTGLYLSEFEKEQFKEIVEGLKLEKKKRRIVVFQPFGSAVTVPNKKPFDPSNRSLLFDHYLKIVKAIEKDAVVIYASEPMYKHPQDENSVTLEKFPPYFRSLMGFVYHCDLFVGCDSVGQHIARFMSKPGIVFMGGTDERNVSYPDHFEIIRKQDRKPIFSPLRLSEADHEFSDRTNDGIMNYTDEELNNAIEVIQQKLGLTTTEVTEYNTKITY